MVNQEHEDIERLLQDIEYLEALYTYDCSPKHARATAYAKMLVARSHRRHSKAYTEGSIFDKCFIRKAAMQQTKNALVSLALASWVSAQTDQHPA